MKIGMRGAAVSLLALAIAGTVGCSAEQAAGHGGNEPAAAAASTVSAEEKEQVSYAVGVGVGNRITPMATLLDMAALRQGIEGVFAGAEPPMGEEEGQATLMALEFAVMKLRGQPLPELPPGVEVPEVDPAKAGQVMGFIIGHSLNQIKADLDLDALFVAIDDVVQDKPLKISPDDAMARVQAFAQQRLAAQGEDNRRAGAEFLEANGKRPGVITLESGLQYQILRPGAGERPQGDAPVQVHYQGRLLDGTVFDSSYERGQPAVFALNQVIPGWAEGVALMPVGAKYRFWIPSELAYGANGAPGGLIGPDATLSFDVELLRTLPQAQ